MLQIIQCLVYDLECICYHGYRVFGVQCMTLSVFVAMVTDYSVYRMTFSVYVTEHSVYILNDLEYICYGVFGVW